MSTIGAINVKVSADTGNFDKGMQRARDTVATTSKEVDKGAGVFTKYRGAITAAATAAAAYAASAAIRKIIQNTIEQERATAQLEQTLRSTGRYTPELSKQMQVFASQLQQVSTYGDEAILRSQALLLTFTQISGDVFPKAQQAILDVATAMQMDLKSASLQVGKALNDPILGVTALSRSGIQFTEDQKDVIKSLVETGDVAGAQAIILKELETQFGGSAEAARNTLGGAIESLKNAFGDLLEGSGGNLTNTTESINNLTTRLNDPKVKEGFDNIVNGALFVASALTDATVALSSFGTKIGEVIYGNNDVETNFEKAIKRTKVELMALEADMNQFGKPGPVGAFLTIFGNRGEMEAKAEELRRQLAQQESDLAFYREKYKKDPVITPEAIVAPDIPEVVKDVAKDLPEVFDDAQKAILEKIQNRMKSEEQLELEKYQREKALIEKGATDKAEQFALLEKLQAEHNERMAEIQATTVPEGMQYTPEANQAFLDGLAERFASESELWAMKYQSDLERLQEARAQELITEEQFLAQKASLEDSYSQQQVAREQQVQQQITSMRLSAAQSAIGLLDLFAGKSKAAAIAAIALNKALSIAQIIQNTAVAQMRALAELGPIAGAAAAAKIGMYGKIQAGIAAATGLVQIGQAASGSASTIGSVNGLPAVRTMGGQSVGQSSGAPRTISINLVGGGMFSAEQIRELIGMINEQTGDGVNLAVGG